VGNLVWKIFQTKSISEHWKTSLTEPGGLEDFLDSNSRRKYDFLYFVLVSLKPPRTIKSLTWPLQILKICASKFIANHSTRDGLLIAHSVGYASINLIDPMDIIAVSGEALEKVLVPPTSQPVAAKPRKRWCVHYRLICLDIYPNCPHIGISIFWQGPWCYVCQ